MIRIESNAPELRRLMRQHAGQIPFATSRAINATAKDVKRNTEKRMRRVFDRPTPFTMRGVFTQFSTKRRLIARVGIKDRQAEYLGIQETGGTRSPKAGRKALVVASEARRNQYGNLSRNQVRRLLARPDTFSGRIGGVGGIWQRFHGQLHLLVVWAPKAKYERRFGFREEARRTARTTFRGNFEREFRAAVRRAR